MDQTTLEQLTAALTAVINDEDTLQAAITAVQSVVPAEDPNDALVASVVSAFETAGYTVTAPEPTAPAAS